MSIKGSLNPRLDYPPLFGKRACSPSPTGFLGGASVGHVIDFVCKNEYNWLAGKLAGTGKHKEGDIGGYPIPQYRKKKWQIPKYRVENRLNADIAHILITFITGSAYL